MNISGISQLQSIGNSLPLSLLQTATGANASSLSQYHQSSAPQTLSSSSSANYLASSIANLPTSSQNDSDSGSYLLQYMNIYNKLSLVQLLGDNASNDSTTLLTTLSSITDALSSSSNMTSISGALLNLYA